MTAPLRLGIVGGGPSALFLYQALLDRASPQVTVEIFESGSQLGAGMPYSPKGAGPEHVTNVSGNEIPPLPQSLVDWLKEAPSELLDRFDVDRKHVHEFKVIHRLLFGEYLSQQFEILHERRGAIGTPATVHSETPITGIDYDLKSGEIVLSTAIIDRHFDVVVLCTGHHWPSQHEGATPNYFDSPYPPRKLDGLRNHSVAIRGASLTAIDAIRTLARNHGTFITDRGRTVAYQANANAPQFKMVMHSREGFLPGIRFHLEDPRLKQHDGLTPDQLESHRRNNDGFISLDFVFEADFKESFRELDPSFYKLVRALSLEKFVELMTHERDRCDPFEFFRCEYDEALSSIRDEQSIHWKEKLATASFTLSRVAKYFSAEDMLRFKKTLTPLISVVIAFTPQCSCEELLAFHAAGRLELVNVAEESRVEPNSAGGVDYYYGADAKPVRFETFIDGVGQQPLSFEQFPFASLRHAGVVSPATVRFQSLAEAAKFSASHPKEVVKVNGEPQLLLPGVAITDNFEAVNREGTANSRLYVMAVPLIAGHHPDYSSLDFCEEAAKRIVSNIYSSV
ncbi:FAD/NAD(P)-binding protein [Lacipirellula parvula]|uniref:FAD-dependent urate hydroxylase HpyO/Asp monooxygenase CreE-like FAD/NAD(P)-binding domain-containing protein n=1 Tax=Lacipirellula parvula TaxID=2650471 RepID=A0A5K7XJD4_9BACT|nr:FAD/NAD(P)-binding protein [Lacipirellula parvula]BBO35161.1 hypothetical protein PLANPX_4773 [Lacipirellula parvula]